MRLDELTPIGQLRKGDQSDLVDVLKKYGFHQLGSGDFGTVLEHPHRPYVIKIFHSDPCYIEFVQLANQHRDNPHFPRFIGKPISTSWDKELFGIRMEKLEDVQPGEDSLLVDIIKLYLRMSTTTQPQSYPDITTRLNTQMRYIINNGGQPLLAAVDLLKDHFVRRRNACNLDIHLGNCMKRGDTLVIIDPFYTIPSDLG